MIIVVLDGSSKNKYDSNEFHKMYGNETGDVGAMLQEIYKMNLYFGHQSVGFNIIEELEKWEDESGSHIQKVETKNYSSKEDATFVHFRIGENSEPKSQILILKSR